MGNGGINLSAIRIIVATYREFLDIPPLNINFIDESFKINLSFADFAWKTQVLRKDETHINLIDGPHELLILR